jgi:two-component system sensor histidine kinase UhpB
MTLKFRLILVTNTLIFMSIFLGLYIVTTRSIDNVKSEIQSSISLATFAIKQSIQKNPDYIRYLEQNRTIGLSDLPDVRHIIIDYYNADGLIVESNKKTTAKEMRKNIPKWLQWFFDSKKEPFDKPVVIPLNLSGKLIGSIYLTPDPTSEYEEVWRQFKSGLLATIIFVFILNVSIYIIFSRLLIPISRILRAFDQLGKNDFNNKIPPLKIIEFEALRKKFNKMSTALKKSNQEISKLNQTILDIQEEEKRSISRDLHDDLAQSLVALQAESVAASRSKNMALKNKGLQSIVGLSKQMIYDLRNVMQRLSLGILDEIGLDAALKDLIQVWIKKNNIKKINVKVRLPNQATKFNQKQCANIYRIVQEGLTNINKHSSATDVAIQIYSEFNKLNIEIKNNGVLKRNKVAGGLGLIGMRERVLFLRGKFSAKKIKSNFGIKIQIPIP